ncbi:MAG: gliding motility-associated C-terminal domain-containing protein [Lewinella sp.]|nr:gliding motility-associated C-terminal domain-containing protein [Lewinella sp.]
MAIRKFHFYRNGSSALLDLREFPHGCPANPTTKWPTRCFSIAYAFVDAFSLTTIGARPTLVLEDLIQCTPPTAVEITPGPFACATYEWSTGATTSSITLNSAGTYSLTVTTPCGVLTDDFTLTFGGATQTINETTCAGTAFLLNGQSYSAPGTYVQNLTAANGCDSTLTLVLTVVPSLSQTINETTIPGMPFMLNGEVYTAAGTYVQNLIAANGCDSLLTLILSIGEENIFIPNAISPNGDGRNDFFKPLVDIDDVFTVRSLLIFDRWGGIVFELPRPVPLDDFGGWDGSSRGKTVGLGVYIYRLILERPNGSTLLRSGEVLVVR